MKHLILTFILIPLLLTNAQFREQTEKPIDIKGSITNNQPSSSFLHFLDSENFQMHHSVGMSYSSFGGNGVMLGTYTNSMYFKILDNLDIRVDASLVTSPYSTFGEKFSKDISGIYISRAEINYRPTKDSKITIQYFNPVGGFYPYGAYGYSRFYDPFNEGMGR